jgi:hypothetical protein
MNKEKEEIGEKNEEILIKEDITINATDYLIKSESKILLNSIYIKFC